jgi:hypothetical protein
MMHSAAGEQRAALRADSRKPGQRGGAVVPRRTRLTSRRGFAASLSAKVQNAF